MHEYEKLQPERFIRMMRDRLESMTDVEVKEVFKFFDTDGSGSMDYDEFRLGLAKIGFSLPQNEIRRLFESFNVDENDTISYV